MDAFDPPISGDADHQPGDEVLDLMRHYAEEGEVGPCQLEDLAMQADANGQEWLAGILYIVAEELEYDGLESLAPVMGDYAHKAGQRMRRRAEMN